MAGTTLEWYDFFIFGTMAALVLDQLFFPELDPTVGKIAAFATFAAGFVARPLGGIVFGHIGDRFGRKRAMVASMTMMGVATALMGLLPTYAAIGIAAPILLTVLRFFQGLALGGEWGSAAALLVEHAPAGRRGFYGGWVQLGGLIGPLLSTVTVLALSAGLSTEQFYDWGWRIPFLISTVLVVVGLYVRKSLPETPEFEHMRAADERARFPLWQALREHPKNIALVFFMHLASTTIAFIGAVFILSYATGTVNFSRTTVLLMVALVTLVKIVPAMMLTQLSDRFGRRPVFLTGTIGLAVIAFPYFWLIETGNTALLALGLLLGGAANTIMYMTEGAFFIELFPVEGRASGASLGVQSATVIGGGTAPLIATALLSWSGGASWSISLYLMLVGAIASIAVLLAPETGGRRKDAQPGSGAPAEPARPSITA
ncbi:hypothetical protein AXA44_08790 [Rhodococcus sp. SC4]|nr:hypothetical protein AXA44_08790 [Rhodococcus sp. SC4]